MCVLGGGGDHSQAAGCSAARFVVYVFYTHACFHRHVGSCSVQKRAFFLKKVFIVFMRERVTACAVRERYEAAAAAAGCRSPVHRTAVKQRPLMARVRSAHARATPDVSVGQDTCSDGL